MVSASSGSSSAFFGDFIAEEVKGVEDKASGDATMVDVQTSWRPFWTYPWDLPVSLMKIYDTKQNLQLLLSFTAGL